MEQTTQAADPADTPTTAAADKSGNAPDDRAAVTAALAEVGTHPYLPAALRDAWPALLRLIDERDRQMADLAAEVQGVRAELRALVQQLTPGA